ncbi:WXG100 family type VII secretion target [Myceligenerans indicum]|uniref:ESAT-6-like protein n=1 Tax=Myceligenerans indicum TaxID=2593663 RepID=A0ABS1LKB8_9MICO|nr:WXG100 family type VII secretion target [Myceligenerans indicum]MBL0886558.1 WXG100 family type VII secretion target [Myceligenerans indicum]
MPNINVTFQEMEDAAARMQQEAADMQGKLDQLRSMVDNLVQDGYVTDKSSKRFDECYKDLDKGGKQLMEGLDGIGQYLKEAAGALRKTDEELANALNK